MYIHAPVVLGETCFYQIPTKRISPNGYEYMVLQQLLHYNDPNRPPAPNLNAYIAKYCSYMFCNIKPVTLVLVSKRLPDTSCGILVTERKPDFCPYDARRWRSCLEISSLKALLAPAVPCSGKRSSTGVPARLPSASSSSLYRSSLSSGTS